MNAARNSAKLLLKAKTATLLSMAQQVQGRHIPCRETYTKR
jgi:hypothetical protein